MKIELPQVGESVTEGVIGKWLKTVGDQVEKFDPLVEIVTDKVAMELPSPVSGILREIMASEGETVLMGSVIADIDSDENQTPPPATKLSQSVGHADPSKDQIGTTGVLLKGVAPVGPTGSGRSQPVVENRPTTKNGRYSPAVLRLAEANEVDLSLITGSGRNERITRKDVQAFIDSRSGLSQQPTGQSVSKIQDSERRLNNRTSEFAEEQRISLSPVRKIIAANMVKSATLIPQAWSLVEVDVSNMVARRQSTRDNFRQREGVNITYLPFVIKAVAESLKENPLLNSSWGEDCIIMKRRINVGIAVAARDGLVVPVIHDADNFSIAGLALKIEDISNRARNGNLTVEDVHSGTFTVNNTGVLGSLASQPLVNYPQAAIMTTEAIVRRPVVVGDGISIRSMMNICLTFDHRIMDGQQASRFNMDVKSKLESLNENSPIY